MQNACYGLWLGADVVKASVGLRSSLLLCIILAFSEEESVSIGCTSSTFWAVVPLTLLDQGRLLHSDEVSLRTGCPVTSLTEKGYEFNYLVIECGIEKENISSFLDATPSTIHNSLTKFKSDIPSTSPCSSWNLTNPYLFELPWIPYFQHSSAKPSHQSLPLKMPHSLVHESTHVVLF
ncbi:LOW QUALITY PROTEIN: oocyte-secreted protein 3 [Phocoena phocoena]|uniref:LOW QUALITY PROTEIN: oocyte-secreted protein 3 n=1 Tax=Phocoena phocoena TaxID=9742 RepID=UPI003306F7BC